MKIQFSNIAFSKSSKKSYRITNIEVEGLIITWDVKSGVTYAITSSAFEGSIESSDGIVDLSDLNISDPIFEVVITPLLKGSKPAIIEVVYPEVGVGFYAIGQNFRIGKVYVDNVGVGFSRIDATPYFTVG